MSSIRVNPYPLTDLLAAVERLQKQQNTAALELATGSKINAPSDDPGGAATLAGINDLSSQVDSFQQSITSITGQLATADSTLSSVVTALQRAITLGVEGANGTLSASDRADVASELSGIQGQLVSLANTSYQGQYLFAGTANTQPFLLDSSSASGVRYAGNQGVNQVAIGSGYAIAINQPGSTIFNGSGADVFQSLQDLITALNSNSNISGAVNEVSAAYNYVTVQRVFYGNAQNQASAQQTYLSSEKVSLSQQATAVSGADIATVAPQLTSGQTAMSATLAAIGKMLQNSLFDYLK